MRIYKSPSILRKCFPEALWSLETSEKNLYLTFDDGPHEEITPWVMEELEKHNAHATFFCTGKQVEKNRSTFDEILKRGFDTGNHTYNHFNGWRKKKVEYLNDVEKAEKVFTSKLFRPPYGKMRFSQYEALKNQYQIVMWDIVSYDWDKSLHAEKCLNNVVSNIGSGSIIVFHDSEKAFKNLNYVLPRFLEEMSSQGYSFSSLKRSIAMVA